MTTTSKVRSLIGLLVLIIEVTGFSSSHISRPISISSWLAYGDIRGHIEPCGCDPATDLGGLRRLIKVIDQEQSLDPLVQVFSLGNLMEITKSEMPSLKNSSILRGVALTKPTATLPGPSELDQIEALKDFAKERSREFQQINFVLSNSKLELQKIFATKLETKNLVVFGYVQNPKVAHSSIEPWSIERFKSLANSQAKSKTAVLLYRGPNDLLKEVVSLNLFNIIITGNQAPGETLPSQYEKLNEALLTRLETPPIYQVPLGGQGVLRGGRLQNRDTPTFQDLLKGPQTTQENPFRSKKQLVTWLTPAIGNSPLVDSIFDDYERLVKTNFQREGQMRLQDLASTPFAGITPCRSCHQPIVDLYAQSRHARAMQTLIDKKKDQDAYCVSCHSVGSKAKGGFVSNQESPFLANVQCENCHGPRKSHSLNPLPSTQRGPQEKEKSQREAQEICLTCHNVQHSPNFKYETYWPKIKHP